jgi:hypothetical protein
VLLHTSPHRIHQEGQLQNFGLGCPTWPSQPLGLIASARCPCMPLCPNHTPRPGCCLAVTALHATPGASTSAQGHNTCRPTHKLKDKMQRNHACVTASRRQLRPCSRSATMPLLATHKTGRLLLLLLTLLLEESGGIWLHGDICPVPGTIQETTHQSLCSQLSNN